MLTKDSNPKKLDNAFLYKVPFSCIIEIMFFIEKISKNIKSIMVIIINATFKNIYLYKKVSPVTIISIILNILNMVFRILYLFLNS